ncbi:MAG: NusG domain II-containing protein [Clostridia bacterium]|nr:NusG domain II-containing protein [Clostridia bacterium]
MKEANVAQKKRLIFDLALVLCLLLFALVLFFVTRKTNDGGTFVRVTLGGELVAEYSLEINGEYTLNGGTNILLISNGEASVIYANCPDKICKKTSPISLVGERIVCLPNRIMIEIVGDGEVDFVS